MIQLSPFLSDALDCAVARELDPEMTAFADYIAWRRHDQAVRYERRPVNGAPTAYGPALRLNIVGVRCELIAWLYLRELGIALPWHALRRRIHGAPDIGSRTDVKGRERGSRLIVQKDGVDDCDYWLVVCEHPRYWVCGWLTGFEAKRAPLAGPREAHFVEALRPLGELLERLALEARPS